MIFTRTDELALAECRQCVERCETRRIKPAPYFPLILRMYEELERHGMVQRENAPPEDACRGCPAMRDGNCLNGYQMAVLSLDSTRVNRCGFKQIALERERHNKRS